VVSPDEGTGAERTRDTYLAVLRPWFGFLANNGYQWNARPEAVREYTRLFLLEAGCALRTGRVEGWFVQATNRSPISANGLHLLIAALRSFYTAMLRAVFDAQDQRHHPHGGEACAGPRLPGVRRIPPPQLKPSAWRSLAHQRLWSGCVDGIVRLRVAVAGLRRCACAGEPP
jgi:hypothetical protein